MGIDDLVGAYRRPARAFGLFLDWAHSRALLVDDDEELERGLTLRAGDAHDPRGLELAEHADVGARVIGSANAAFVFLRLVAEESEDVHFRSSIPGRFNGRPVRHARNAYWSARSSTCLSSTGTAQYTAAKSSGRCVSAAPTRRPPFDPPEMARLRVLVHPPAMSASPAAWKSSKTFCFLPSIPARCQLSPYSPPPRRFGSAKRPPASTHAAAPGKYAGVREMLNPP